jgi:hypothetical protein
MMLIFYFTCTYAILSPIIVAISLFGSILSYIIDKYLVLRRCKKPELMSSNIPIFFSNLIPYGCIMYGFSCNYFYPHILE